jgi:hypothetical protein
MIVLGIVLAILGAWFIVSVLLALGIGRGIKIADREARKERARSAA